MAYSETDFQRIKKRVQQIIADQSTVKQEFKDIADLYWLSDPGNIKINKQVWSDIKYTKSTSSRDSVTGLHRLIKTSKPDFHVKCKNEDYANKIEAALRKWWAVSNERKIATNESELTLSGALFSDENLEVTAVADMIEAVKKAIQQAPDNAILKVQKQRLEDLQKRTPILFEVASPLNVYPIHGRDGLNEYLTRFQIKGKRLREDYGVTEAKDDTLYDFNDYFDMEWRCMYVDQFPEPVLMGRFAESLELKEMPRFSVVCDGTDLFPEEIRKRQPFLYGKLQSGMADREDETLTAIFTSVNAHGTGQLLVIDTSAPGYDANKPITVSYAGVQPYMLVPGGGRFADNKAFDNALIALLGKLDEMGQRTTIPTQTLGENISSGTPFSGYAAAQKGGQLSVVPIAEGTEKVIRDAALYAIRLFKAMGLEWEGLKPEEILDDIELEVKLDVDLPQDDLRNAQVLAQLAPNVHLTQEYMHNFLHISDSKKMTFDWMTEKATEAAFTQDLPNLIQEMLMVFKPPAPPEGTPPPGGIPTPPGEPPGQVNPSYPSTPGGMGEQVPATAPVPPEARGRA